MHGPSQPDAIAEIKGEQSRKNVTVGSRAHKPFETNLEFKLGDQIEGTSPQPSTCGLTKQSSDTYAANSTDQSKRQAVLSFGKGSNAPSCS